MDDNTISVNNTGRLLLEVNNRPYKLDTYALGNGTVWTQPNQLYVEFYEFGGCGQFSWLCGGIQPEDTPQTFVDPFDPRNNYQGTVQYRYSKTMYYLSCRN